ncbi:MAG TPA: 3-hydroxybutyrate dehydrogenase [Burkholderiaceae bacterium]|nr:3-hydroxybutyrate dehydrogenase [Burkholderiaceae bacterium]
MLKDKLAVVTGSTSGIGLAIARELAASGAHIVINGFGEPDAIEQERSSFEKDFGVRAYYIGADLSQPDSTRAFIDEAASKLGGIDILVNNAGIQHTDRVEDFPVDRWDAIIALNLSAVFHGTAAALPHMQNNGWGRIINIASVHGQVASVEKSAYVAAKHGVIGLTKVTALENAGSGITCNAICPGWVRTPLVEKQIEALAVSEGLLVEEAAKLLLSEKQPSLQFVTPRQLGAAAVYLSSDAAEQMTGANLTMDGGWTAR